MFMAKKATPTAWAGWVFFGAAMLVLIGAMQLVQGLGAIFNPNFFVVTQSHIFAFDVRTWGWIHTILGILALAGGIGTMAGSGWARIVAVVITVLALLGSIAYITTFPLWSIFELVIGGIVIYAFTVHGAETEELV
jgi:hypothetical protein